MAVFSIDLICAVVLCPGSFNAFHLRLEFPKAALGRLLVDADGEVDREHRLRIVAECSCESHALDFCVAYLADPCSGFVRKAFAEVHEDVVPAGREGVALDACAWCGAYFSLDVVCCEVAAIVSWLCNLIRVFGSINMIVHLQVSVCRHCEGQTHFRTSDSAEVYM